MRRTTFFTHVLVGLALFSCVNNNERDFIKPADTNVSKDLIIAENVSFSKQIIPILKSRCVECHSPKTSNPNKPDDFSFSGVDVIVDYREIEVRILSSDPNLKMPYRQEALTNEQIGLIRSWISQGEQNN